MPSISIIIPTLNEAYYIESLLQYLTLLDRDIEIIVSDGSSTDNTAVLAQSIAKVTQAQKGRGTQMNAGARIATGDILWFLHADCSPHPDSILAIRQALTDLVVVGGGFEYNIEHPASLLRITEITSNLKNHLLKLLFGDMGIFVRKVVFERMGGYKEIPLMEDMDFCKRLKKMGKIVILPQRMNTSGRRWEEEGIVVNFVRNTLLQLGWTLGISPKLLAKWYKFR